MDMESEIPPRYEANPMLALVENYVLDAIGKLEPDKEKLLAEIVCRTFGGNDWRAVIRAQFQLPDDSARTLQALWKQRCEEADAQQQELPAEDFARQQADAVFAGLGGI